MTANRYRVSRYTIESTDHRARMTAHEDGQWMAKADYDALANELTKLKNARELSAQASATMRDESIAKSERIAQLESALTLLTNGFKYPTEVCQIARNAIAQETHSKSQQKRIAALTAPETDLKPCWCSLGCLLKTKGEVPAGRYCKQQPSESKTGAKHE